MSIIRQIFAIAIPAIVSNITTPLLGLVDVAIVGHIGSAAYIGAVAIGTTMFNMLYWLFSFLRMGTAGLTAQAYGANDFRISCATLWRSLMLAVGIAAVMIILSRPLCSLALSMLNAQTDVEPLARSYFMICIFGAPAVLATYALNGWFLGMQNTRIPMYVALLTNVVNIAASATLVFGYGMKIEGVALGTITAQWVGVLMSVALLLAKYRPARIALRSLLEASAFSRLFKINLDIFLRTLCLVAVTVWFTRSGASQSAEILAANTLLLQLFMFFSYFTDGYAFAGEALAGKFYGAADRSSLRSLVKTLLRRGAEITILFTLIYYLGGDFIINMLTNESVVISTARQYLPWAIVIPVCGILAFMYDGIYIGLTRTRIMLISIALASAVYFALWFALSPILGNHALWAAFLSYLLIRGIYLHLALKI